MVSKVMFWNDSMADLQISIFLTVIAFVIALIIYFFKRKIILSLFVFSLLGNLSFYDLVWSRSLIFWRDDFKWLEDVTKIYWPIINIILLIILIFNYWRNVKNKK